MTVENKSFVIWLFKQTIGVIILIVTNIAQYNYFTKQLDKRDTKIDELEDKVDILQHQVFYKSISPTKL